MIRDICFSPKWQLGGTGDGENLKGGKVSEWQPGNNEEVDVGGNEEEGVGEGKDDGNAQDGGKPV